MRLIRVIGLVACSFTLLSSCEYNNPNDNEQQKQFYDEDGLLVKREFYKAQGRDSSVFIESTYKDDTIPHGYARSYYRSGQIMGEEHYEKGIKHGVSKQFYQDGQLKQISWLKNGALDSLGQMYYENGKLKVKSHWKKGHQIGEQIYYSPGGEISKYSFYNPIGELVYKSEYDQNGKGLSEEGSKNTQLIYEGEDDQFYVGETLKVKIYAPTPPDKKVGLSVALNNSKGESLNGAQVVSIKNGLANYKVMLDQPGVYSFETLLTSEDRQAKNPESFTNNFQIIVREK